MNKDTQIEVMSSALNQIKALSNPLLAQQQAPFSTISKAATIASQALRLAGRDGFSALELQIQHFNSYRNM